MERDYAIAEVSGRAISWKRGRYISAKLKTFKLKLRRLYLQVIGVCIAE